MADNISVAAGSYTNTLRTKDNAGTHLQLVGIADTTGANILAVDASGRLTVQGGAAAGAAVAGNPILIGGSDGTNARTLVTDTAGYLRVHGYTPAGNGISGAPVMMGVSDGTLVRFALGDTSGRQIVVGGAASGAAVAGNPVLIGGSDGTNARTLKVDSTGAVTIIAQQDAVTTGTITSAASTVGPVTVTNRNLATISIRGTYAGVTFVVEASDDGTNYFPIQSINNATGVVAAAGSWTPGTNATASYDVAIGGYTNLRVRSTAWTSGTANVGITLQTFAYDPVVGSVCQGTTAAGSAVTGYPVLAGGSDGTNARFLSTDTSGRQVVVGAAADGAAVTGNPVLIAGQDGTNAQSISTDTTGRQIVVGGAASGATISGNPLLAGWTFTSTQPTVTTGQAVNAQATARGELLVCLSNTTTKAVITAASTSAAAADPALAVAISPNLPTPSQNFTNSAATTNATSVKASAGKVFTIIASNTNAAARYLKLYNKASAPTVGTDVPVFTFTIGASSHIYIDTGVVGIYFSTGIAFALTTGAADSDTGAVAANEIKVGITYI